MPRELTITARDGARLAVVDHGGTGCDVLLLHTVGFNLESWGAIVPLLPGARVVAMDLRSHGQSGDGGGWSFDDLVDDVEAVVAGLELRAPVVVGHSLGGCVALEHAARKRECAAVVNVDGHGFPPAKWFDPSIDAATFRTNLAEAMAALWRGRELSGDQGWAQGVINSGAEVMRLLGASEEIARSIATRLVHSTGGDAFAQRPPQDVVETLYSTELDRIDPYEAYANIDVDCTLIYCQIAVGSSPDPQPYSDALEHAVASIEGSRVRVVRVTGADHAGVLFTHAPQVASSIGETIAQLS